MARFERLLNQLEWYIVRAIIMQDLETQLQHLCTPVLFDTCEIRETCMPPCLSVFQLVSRLEAG